jgi:hypothetical protein
MFADIIASNRNNAGNADYEEGETGEGAIRQRAM